MNSPRVSVIVPCHNYGRYLNRCLKSILQQTRKADEVVVVDDNSHDNTREIALSFSERGVRYIHTNNNNPLETRRAGFQATTGDIICFIDADDYISENYLEFGLSRFSEDSAIAIVYSDVEYHGWITGRHSQPELNSRSDLYQDNTIHAGALVRRDAIELSDAFSIPTGNQHEDWHVWRRILDSGFSAVRQKSLYFYRRHDENLSLSRIAEKDGYSYFTSAALSSEQVTLFVALSGTLDAWERTREFLEAQTWSREQIDLLLFDCSASEQFGKTLKGWLVGSHYRSIHIEHLPQFRGGWTPVGLEWNLPWASSRTEWLQNHRIIALLNRLVNSHYLWILEEGTTPPRNACEALLREFDRDTVSVAAASPRCMNTVYAWQADGTYASYNAGVTCVEGNSFTCAILRAPILRNILSSQRKQLCPAEWSVYDGMSRRYKIKIKWDVVVQQRSSELLPLTQLTRHTEQRTDPQTDTSIEQAVTAGTTPRVLVSDLLIQTATPFLYVQAILQGEQLLYRIPRKKGNFDEWNDLSNTWMARSFEESRAINNFSTQADAGKGFLNQILFRIPKGYLVICTETELAYTTIRNFLTKCMIWNEACVTPSPRGSPSLHGRHFWLKYSENCDVNNLPKRTAGLKILTQEWVTEFKDSAIYHDGVPFLDDAEMASELKQEIDALGAIS